MGLASSGGQCQQNAFLPGCDGFQDWLDGDFLIVASLKVSAAVGGVGIANCEFSRVVVRLAHALRQLLFPGLRFDRGQFGIGL